MQCHKKKLSNANKDNSWFLSAILVLITVLNISFFWLNSALSQSRHNANIIKDQHGWCLTLLSDDLNPEGLGVASYFGVVFSEKLYFIVLVFLYFKESN